MMLGFFFGAGAEVGYGLPSGGRFAIDLFRQDVSQHKQDLRQQLQNSIDRQSVYATHWLPERFETQRIHAFGKNEFTNLIESSIEYRKQEIIRRINDLDNEADIALNQLNITAERLAQRFEQDTGIVYGTRLYSQVVRVNQLLAREVQLFNSEFYSAILDVIRNNPNSANLQRYAASFIQLLVGAHGQDLVQRLNQELFTEAPDDIPIFDDISGMFRLEFNRVGLTALELLLGERHIYNIDENADILELLSALAQKILENIFSTVLDYQSLIDNHFRYLYSPKTEWAKFTKMVIFLRTTREYIWNQLQRAAPLPDQGYYHDLQWCAEHDIIRIGTIGTSNYNSLIEKVSNEIGLELPLVIHLNGGVNDYYNPYKNTIVTYEDINGVPQDEIHVPFIFTQSGLKPLTSVEMSRRYVQLFDGLSECDGIVVVGFGFNIDDSHINGMFRQLVEDRGRSIYWVCKVSDQTAPQLEREIRKKLRITSNNAQVYVITVDDDRQLNGVTWIEAIYNRIIERNNQVAEQLPE